MNGVDKAVVDRAESLIVKLAQGEDLVSACAAMTAAEMREYAYAVSWPRRQPLALHLHYENESIG